MFTKFSKMIGICERIKLQIISVLNHFQLNPKNEIISLELENLY